MISFEQLIKATGRIEVKRVGECALVPGPLTFPLRTVRDIQIDGDLRGASERLEQSDPFVEGELLELEDGNLLPDDGENGAKTPRKSSIPRRIAPSMKILGPLWASRCPFPARRGSIPRVSVHRLLPRSASCAMICPLRSRPKIRNSPVRRCMLHMSGTRLPRQSVRPEPYRGFSVDGQMRHRERVCSRAGSTCRGLHGSRGHVRNTGGSLVC